MMQKSLLVFMFIVLCLAVSVSAIHNVYYTVLDDTTFNAWNLNPDGQGNIIIVNDGMSSIGALDVTNHTLIKYSTSSGTYSLYDTGIPYNPTIPRVHDYRFYTKTPTYELFIQPSFSYTNYCCFLWHTFIYKKTGSNWVFSLDLGADTPSYDSSSTGFSYKGNGDVNLLNGYAFRWNTYSRLNDTLNLLLNPFPSPVNPAGVLIERNPSTATYLYSNIIGSYDGTNLYNITNSLPLQAFKGIMDDNIGQGFMLYGDSTNIYKYRYLARQDKDLSSMTLNSTEMNTTGDCSLISDFTGNRYIASFDCNADYSDCYAVGYDDTTKIPYTFWFNRTACEYVSTDDVVFVNETPRSIAYIPQTNEWYVSGNGFFYKFSTSETSLPSDFTVSIYDVNSKNVVNNDGSQTVYVYPLYAGYPINAYYQLSSSSVNNYFNVICDYSENVIVNDTFEYQNISVGGWTPALYSTAVFDTRYGTSLFLNGSGSYVGDVRRAIIPSTTDAVNIKYLIRPSIQSGQTFSQATVRIQDGLGYDIMRYSYDYNTTTAQTCVYADIPSRTLLYCLDDDGNNFIENEIDISINNQLYSMKTNIGLDAKYTAGLTPLKTFSNVGYVAVGIASSDYDAYYEYLTESIVPRYPALYQVNSSLNVTTGQNIWQYSACDYSTIKCYKTRFFQQSTSTQAWNHYEDFDLCSSQTSQYVTQLDSDVASFWNGLFGTDATSTQASRITTAVITMIVVFLVSLIALWVMLNDGKFAVAIATVVTSIMFVMFSITGFFPAWVVVLIIIFVSGILMIFARRIVTGG